MWVTVFAIYLFETFFFIFIHDVCKIYTKESCLYRFDIYT